MVPFIFPTQNQAVNKVILFEYRQAWTNHEKKIMKILHFNLSDNVKVYLLKSSWTCIDCTFYPFTLVRCDHTSVTPFSFCPSSVPAPTQAMLD